MCSEPKGLSGWPRTTARWCVFIAASMIALGIICAARPSRNVSAAEPNSPKIAKPSPNSPDEPFAKNASLAKSVEFLDNVALNWTRERKCGACHTNYAYLLARPAIPSPDPSPYQEIRQYFEDRVAHWDDGDDRTKPKFDAEIVATAAALSLNDAATSGKLHPLTRKALDRLWTIQNTDGTWGWLNCDLPPLEYDDYYGAVFAAVGIGVAPEGYAKSDAAKPGLDKLKAFFHANPAPNLHHQTFLLWASNGIDGLLTPEQKQETITQLLAKQRLDGGWSLPSLGLWNRRDRTPNDPEKSPSDGYGTGLVVYVLRQSGIEPAHPSLAKAVSWLKENQRESGRWFTRSLNNDKAHYITNAGTAFAAVALQACEPAQTKAASIKAPKADDPPG